MRRIVVRLSSAVKRRLRKRVHWTRDARLKQRYQIVLLWAKGWSSGEIAGALGCAKSTAQRWAHRYLAEGEAGLQDRRAENGEPKVDADLRQALAEMLQHRPTHYGWQRPNWTRELMALQLAAETGVQVSITTIDRMLRALGARWGEPRPVVACPWSKKSKAQRMAQIRGLLRRLPADEVALYQDEVEVHLNPKIGRDWMLPKRQREVLTPGENVKRHVAGTLEPRTGRLLWVWGERRDSVLFIDLLRALLEAYPHAKRIHLILDNCSIHDSQATQDALAKPEFRRLRLHFLPPYSPLENRIERLWRDLHDNVTRNHTCRSIDQLAARVDHFLTTATPWPGNRPSIAPGPQEVAA
jgi:transposase